MVWLWCFLAVALASSLGLIFFGQRVSESAIEKIRRTTRQLIKATGKGGPGEGGPTVQDLQALL